MEFQVRGDPDGCGLDLSLRYSPSSELRVDLPTEDLLNIKKGWLMKQGSTPDVSLCPDVNSRQNMYERVLLVVVLSFFLRNGTNIGLYSEDPRCCSIATLRPRIKVSWTVWLT